MDWIDMKLGDFWEDFPEYNVTMKSRIQPPIVRPLSAGPLELRRCAAGKGNASRLEELLRAGWEGGGDWPVKALRGALKNAANAATVAAIARAHPDFFHSPEGAPAALYLAVKKNKEKTVRALLDAGTPLDSTPKWLSCGMSLVHAACVWNSISCLALLLKAGAVFDSENGGVQPLHIAAYLGYAECINLLLAAGADPEAVDSCGWVPLHHAASTGLSKSVIALLDAGANVNIVGPKRQTALHLAAGSVRSYPTIPSYCERMDTWMYDFDKCCEILLQRGADVYAVDEANMTPMQIAFYGKSGRCFTEFLKADCDLTQRNVEGSTAIHAVSGPCFCNTEEVIQIMVKKGLDVNATSFDGSTPLFRAVIHKNTRAVKALLEHGADTSIHNVNGMTPLHMAAEEGYEEAVQMMLDTGVNMNLRNRNGETPLHKAFRFQNIIKALVYAGADIEAVNDFGRTPFHYSISAGYIPSLDAFEDLGADLQAMDYRGWTAIHMAAFDGAVDSMRWLAKRVASNPGLSETLGLEARAAYGVTPLYLAAIRGRWKTATWLMRHGASPTALNAEGRSALHAAAVSTCAVTLRTLLESARGHDRMRTLRDVSGSTPADVAADVNDLRRILERWGVAA